jgi:hypothetical protein
MNVPDDAMEKIMPAIAGLLVSAVWVWVAVRTTNALRSLTGRKVPFPRRTIWLVKVLALIVGAGGVMGAFVELGLSWYFAALLAGAVVFLALRETVEEIVIPKPPPTGASFLPAWEGYRRLRRNVLVGYAGVASAFGGAVLVKVCGRVLSEIVLKIILVILGLLFIGFLVKVYFHLWKFRYWPCPRCGCSFRGMWDRPWLPKRCRYCGLERWSENSERRS